MAVTWKKLAYEDDVITKALLTTAVVGAALMFTGTASAAITDTVHNLGTSNSIPSGGGPNGGDPNVFSGTGEICIFCHTSINIIFKLFVTGLIVLAKRTKCGSFVIGKFFQIDYLFPFISEFL